MTATFTPSGGSLVTLAGSDTSGCFDQPSGIQMSGATLVQSENLVRSASPARYDRGNHTRRCSFTVTKSYADWKAAVAANATLVAAVEGLGVFILNDGAGNILTINNATCTVDAGDSGAFAVRSFTIDGTA